MAVRRRIRTTWFPSFGTGAPGASVNQSQVYFDTSTTPYTQYVFHAGAWHIANREPFSATSIQGETVSNATPTDGQQLKFNGSEYVPT